MSLYTLRISPVQGAPYSLHEIIINGRTAYAQLSPMTDAEIEDRVRAYLRPPPVVHVRDIKAKSGPKPKGEA